MIGRYTLAFVIAIIAAEHAYFTWREFFPKRRVPVCQDHFYDIGNNGTCPVCGVTMKWDTEEVA